MREQLLLLLTFLSVLAPIVAGTATGDRSARGQLDSAYTRLNQAMSQNNIHSLRQLRKVLEEILAPGELRREMLAGVEQTIAAGGDRDLKRMLSHNLKLERLTVKGDKAVASVEQTADVIRVDGTGTYGPRGKAHRIRGTMLYRDVWRDIGGKWLLTRTEMVKETVFVDGKAWKPAPGMTP